MPQSKVQLGHSSDVTADKVVSGRDADLALSEVSDPQLRTVIRRIVGHDAFRRAVEFPRESVLECDHARVVRLANRLADEMRELHVFNPEVVSAITYMAELMAPAKDEELALAISRAWVLAVSLDDHCETSNARWTEFFDQDANGDGATPLARYIRLTFDAVRPFSSSTFVHTWRQMLLKALLGGFLECRVASVYPAGGCRSSRYLRQMSGYADFWGLTMSLLHPQLAFPDNPKVWVDVLCDINTFLCDYNDAMSVYKEATAGDDLVKNVIYQEGYAEAFPRAVDKALTAAADILDIVPSATRSVFDRFLHGYGIFHLYSHRYRMKELLPDVEYYDMNIFAAH